MDAINRRVAMESLFGFAREHDELQFVFLTPQVGFLCAFYELLPRLQCGSPTADALTVLGPSHPCVYCPSTVFARLFPRLRSLQDIAAVEDARQGCRRMGLHLPEDFVKVVQMRVARANATHA